MELREKIADAVDYSRLIEDADQKRAQIVALADVILAIPEIRVGLSDSEAVQAAIAEFEAKDMASAKNILAWHLRDKLTA